MIDQCQIRNSQTEFARTPSPSAILPSLSTTIADIRRRCTMFWIMLGLMCCGMAAMAILSVDQLDGKVPSRKQEAISWD